MALTVQLMDDPPVQIWANDHHANFAELIARTWNRLPGSAQESLLHWWASPPAMVFDDEHITPPPRIEFKNDLFEQNGTTRAQVRKYGYLLEFQAEVVRFYPPELQEVLVAHELAHAFIYSSTVELSHFFKHAGAPSTPFQMWHEVWYYSCVTYHPLCTQTCLRKFFEVHGQTKVCENFLKEWLERRAREIEIEWHFEEQAFSKFEQDHERDLCRIIAGG